MDSTLPNFSSSNPFNSPAPEKHSHFIGILLAFLILVLIFLGYVVYLYIMTPTPVSERTVPLMEQRVTLTPAQILEKQKIIQGTDMASKTTLSPQQVKQRQLQIEAMSKRQTEI